MIKVVEKHLPKDPSEDDEEVKEACALLADHEQTHQKHQLRMSRMAPVQLSFIKTEFADELAQSIPGSHCH
jgi:hypothetical protein